MGVGKTERAGMNDSRFTKGRRIDATNDRVLRNMQVKGGRVHRSGDKWTIEPNGSDVVPPAFRGSAPEIVTVLTALKSATVTGTTGAFNLTLVFATKNTVTGKVSKDHTFDVPLTESEVVSALSEADGTLTASKVKVKAFGSDSSTATEIELPEGGGGIPDGTADKNMLRWDSTAGAWAEIGPYEEIDVVLFTGNRKITGKMLFKASASDVNYDSTQLYKLLQVKTSSTSGYELGIDHGRLTD